MKNNTNKDNKKIIVLMLAIILVITVVAVVLVTINKSNKELNNVDKDINEALTSNKEAVIFVENSDSKKCSKCENIKKYLDDEKINYITYDTQRYSEKEYKEMLQSLSINPSDFNYPAIIYIKNGIMYSNIININDTKVVEQFIRDYDLKKVK